MLVLVPIGLIGLIEVMGLLLLRLLRQLAGDPGGGWLMPLTPHLQPRELIVASSPEYLSIALLID